MAAIAMMSASSPMIKPVSCNSAPSLNTSLKADLLNRIINSNKGKITGNPSIAISAAF